MPVTLAFNYGFGDKKEEEKVEPDYLPMVDSFRTSLQRFTTDVQTRVETRIKVSSELLFKKLKALKTSHFIFFEN